MTMTSNPDTLAAAERYRQHLEAIESGKREKSPYWYVLRSGEAYLDDHSVREDMELLARAYVERKDELTCDMCGKYRMAAEHMCWCYVNSDEE